MSVSWSALQVRRKFPTSATLERRAVEIQERYGKWATVEVQKKIWTYPRFVYKNRHPKPSRSKSSDLWMYTVRKWSGGQTAIVLSNPATNQYGKKYVPFVHLTGKAKRDHLINEVHAFMAEVVAPKVGAAFAMAYEQEAVKAGTVTRRVTFGGG